MWSAFILSLTFPISTQASLASAEILDNLMVWTMKTIYSLNAYYLDHPDHLEYLYHPDQLDHSDNPTTLN